MGVQAEVQVEVLVALLVGVLLGEAQEEALEVLQTAELLLYQASREADRVASQEDPQGAYQEDHQQRWLVLLKLLLQFQQ